MPFLNREQFIWDFIKKNKIPFCYEALELKNKDYKYINSEQKKNKEELAKVTYVSLFPRIFNPTIVEQNLFNFKKKQHLKLSSVAIINNNFVNADTYLQQHLNASFRSSLRKRVKRIESCFDIQYKMFFGDILKKEYEYIMDMLREMLIKRFQQKNMQNETLDTFEDYKNTAYKLINSKKASLFVIYNNKEPIGISLNYHLDKMFFGTIMTYDIDYSKFGLGNLLIYKQLDWVLKNNYLLFDMGNGKSDYKKAWSNIIYDFEYHIMYKKNSIIASFIAYKEIIKIEIKNSIKLLKIDSYLEKLKAVFIKTKTATNSEFLNFKVSKIEDFDEIPTITLEEINLDEPSFSYLRKPVYDFLYISRDHITSVLIYRIKNEENSYLIKGANSTIKVF